MEKTIYYHDTDSGGVVYYANYLKYMEEARTEFLIQKGLTVEVMQKRNFIYAVRKCSVFYKSPARYGDVIICDAQLVKITAAQLIFSQKIYNKRTNKILIEAEITLVHLNEDFKPKPIPEDLKQQMK